ncbi:hypothetical protein HY642_00955 [Candidatus Woesearchaeota archaeon]|nr:hypothetical protein [Candidatus Woesearchaeota archaeon]
MTVRRMFLGSVIGLLAVGFAAVLSVWSPDVGADTVTSGASVTNAAPQVSQVLSQDPLTLSESAFTQAWCNATITDSNGWRDIVTVNATLWSSENISDPVDFNNHYKNSSCTLSSGTGTTASAACQFMLHYSAAAAEWNCSIIARDLSNATGANTTYNITVSQLKAVFTAGNISFTQQALGTITTNDTERNMQVNNTGNALIDISLDGFAVADGDGLAMNCTVGNITLASLRYNLTAQKNFTTGMAALTDAAVTLTDFDLSAETTDYAASNRSVWWKIQIPNSGVGGNCTGNVIVTAV